MAESAENRAALAALDLAETDAALVSLNHYQALDAAGTLHSSTRMTRKWSKISDKNREALEAALKAREYETDPMADQEARTGRWKVLRVYSSPEKTDPRQQGIYEVLQYWPVGYDGSFGTYCAESSVLHHEDVETFMDAPAPVTCGHAITAGTIYTAANDLDPETGLWRGRLGEDVARTPAKLAWTTGGVLETTSREKQINDTAAPSIAASAEAGTLISGSIDLNRYGRFDWDKATETAQTPAAVTWTDGGPLATAAHTEQMNDSAVPTIGAGAAGTNTSGRVNLNRYGWFDWSKVVETATTPAAITWETGGVLEKTTRTRQLNDAAAPTLRAGGAGTIKTGSIDLNRYGRFDWDTAVETAQTPAAITWETGGVLAKTTNVRQMNASAAPTILAGGAGTLVSGSIDLNRYGWFDWGKSTETAQASAAITWETGSILAKTAHVRQLNASSAPTIAAGAAGHVVRGSIDLNRFGWFDWDKADTELIEKTQTFQETSYFEITTGIRFENAAAIPEYPIPGGVGTAIQSLSFSLTETGRFSGTASATRARTALSSAEITTRDDADAKETRQYFFNQSSVPSDAGSEAAANGTTATSYPSPELNKFGLWNYEKVRTTTKSPYGSLSATIAWTIDGNTEWKTTPQGNYKYLVHRTHDHVQGIALSAAAAAAAITGGDYGSGWGEIGRGMFRWTKVTDQEEILDTIAVEE